MNKDKNSHVINLSGIKKLKSFKKPNLKPIETNELGEVPIKKEPNHRIKEPWQCRFFMSMIVFLLITILVSGWFR